MNCKNKIVNYIENKEYGEPIFINEIKDFILNNQCENIVESEKENLFKNINVILNRLVKEKYIKSYTKGIYYKPEFTAFGEMPIDIIKLLEKKYLVDANGNVNGYVSGEKLFNRLGLTTQVSNDIIIVTNNCSIKKYYDKNLKVTVKKSKIKINNDNYLYLQLLDVLINKEKVNVEAKNKYDIIYDFINTYNLSFEKIIKYAKELNNKKVLNELYILAR